VSVFETPAVVNKSCLLHRDYRDRRVSVVQRGILAYRYVLLIISYYISVDQ